MSIVNSTLQVLPVGSNDPGTYYIAVQPTINGRTNAVYAGRAVTYNASTGAITSSVLTTNLLNVGTINPQTGTTSVVIAGGLTPSGNVSVNLGSPTAWFNTLYGTSSHALYADLAENYQADTQYLPGTVLQFGGTAEVTKAEADTTRIAGVVSTNPAHLMNGGLQGTNVVPVALMGRVPCFVIGPVAKGDLLVSAGFGYAKVNNSPAPGQAIGKALEDFVSMAKGVIEVVVGKI
jgi:hypothetical protein